MRVVVADLDADPTPTVFWSGCDRRKSTRPQSDPFACGRQTLVAAARRNLGALSVAGRLYVEHGDMARAVLHREWTPLWMYAYARLDGLLERAGVPLADEGLVLL